MSRILKKPVVLIGGGGHGLVVLDMIRALGGEVVAVADPATSVHPAMNGISHVRDDSEIVRQFTTDSVLLAIGLGMLPGYAGARRRAIAETFEAQGFTYATLIHPSAAVSSLSNIARGAQIMAGAVVQAGASIGANAIVNTNASIDHDCVIAEHAHVAPGATLCGDVTIEAHAFVGAGAIALPGTYVGANDIVRPGTVWRDKWSSRA